MDKLTVAPFVAYLIGTTLISRLDDAWYPIGYSAVIAIIIAGFIVLLRGETTRQRASELGDNGAASNQERPPVLFRLHAAVLPGIVVGIVGIVLWIILCELGVEQALTAYLPAFLRPGERVSYNPFESINSASWAWAFVMIRIVGLAVVVPVAEELFWRSFLLRWLIDPDWQRIPLGEFTLASCLTVTAMFTLAHPEWLAAATYCLLINALLYWKRDLWQCIVAHGVSNFLLAVYVLQYDQWQLW